MKVQKVNLNIRISPILRKKFKEVAEANNRKCSEVLRELIKEYIMEKDIKLCRRYQDDIISIIEYPSNIGANRFQRFKCLLPFYYLRFALFVKSTPIEPQTTSQIVANCSKCRQSILHIQHRMCRIVFVLVLTS